MNIFPEGILLTTAPKQAKNNAPEIAGAGSFLEQMLAGGSGPKADVSTKQGGNGNQTDQSNSEQVQGETSEPVDLARIEAIARLEVSAAGYASLDTTAQLYASEQVEQIDSKVIAANNLIREEITQLESQRFDFYAFAIYKLSYDAVAKNMSTLPSAVKGLANSAPLTELNAVSEFSENFGDAVDRKAASTVQLMQTGFGNKGGGSPGTTKVGSASGLSNAALTPSLMELMRKKLTLIERDKNLDIVLRDYHLTDSLIKSVVSQLKSVSFDGLPPSSITVNGKLMYSKTQVKGS